MTMRGCCRHSHDAWSRLTLTNHCREKSTSAPEKRTHLLNHSVILGNLSITVLQLCEGVFFFFFGVRQLKITNDSNCTAAETRGTAGPEPSHNHCVNQTSTKKPQNSFDYSVASDNRFKPLWYASLSLVLISVWLSLFAVCTASQLEWH